MPDIYPASFNPAIYCTPTTQQTSAQNRTKKSLVANIFTGPIMEKNHTSAGNATKTSVAETSQQFLDVLNEKWGCRRWFLWGDTPHTPRGGELLLGVNFKLDPYGDKPYNC